MPIFPQAPVRIRLRGMLLQRPVDGTASIAVTADGAIVVPLDAGMHAGVPVRIGFDAIDGVEMQAPDSLVIHLRDGHTLEASGDARVGEVADSIIARGRMVPELTRALRTLGGRRGGTGQDAFFRPLLDARRAASADGTAAIDAFDAVQLRIAIESQLSQLASMREPRRPAAQRSLEACLCDAAEPLLASLTALADAAATARRADPAISLRTWRAWAQAVTRVFDRADAAWLGVRAVLEAPRAPTPAASSAGMHAPWRKASG